MNHYANLRGRRLSRLAARPRVANRSRLAVGARSGARSRSAGFTLLELLLVLSILVVIGGIAAVNIFSASEQANVRATTVQLNSLKSIVSLYKLTMESLPDTLDNLIEGPSDASQQARWTGSMINTPELPTDAWGRELIYTIDGNEFELRSGGVDGQIGTDDDVLVTGP